MAVKGKGKQIAGKAPASSPSSSGKRKSSRSDGESSVAPPKKKSSGVLRFVDDAAHDADFDAEEEEEDDDLEWEIDDDFDFELPDIGAKVVKNVTKGPGKSSPLPFFIKEEVMNDDELEEAIKERYRGSEFISFDDDVKECNESLLVPHATKDLSVWRVKCMMGRERQTSFCLMQKFVDLQKIGKKLQIFSVFALDHVKGFVYVEADKACNVFEACNGLCFLYPSRIELVPRNEAPNLLSIQKKSCGVSKGMWVRLKSGKYKGDLAEVVFVNDAKKRVTIKLIPRIDLQAIAKKFGGGTSLKDAAIPAPRLISPHELEDFRPHIEVRRDRETGEIFEVLDGLMLKDGYLYKKVSICSLIHWGVQPSSDELIKFEEMGKDEVKDISWLSSIYKTQIKKKLPETPHPKTGEKSAQKNGEKSTQKYGEKSNQKKGEKSNQKDEDKQGNGFDIDDFVLFGKKGCGIIIDKENDVFKVLKGDVNGSEVVSVNMGVIKKNCVDKVFTATDRGMKTISIDDVVKVSEGPLEGREGIVRHMFKGVLFIYDECQSENNGFFCAKSGICDLVKKSRDFSGGKLSSNAAPSFAQSPIRSSEQDDNSQSFSRNRQSNSRGTFSVGQTLRICKGPLKGYLCRVIRIYRADVTVKLDSLGKLLTVDEKLLSFPNSKRDDAVTMQCDMFGSQEEQPTGGLLDAGGGLGMDNSSFGRESWNTPSCSSFSFSRDNDNKDQSKVADLWGSKLTSCNGDQDHGAASSWGKAPSSNAEQNSWHKLESGEKGADADCKNDADAWNKTSTKGETSTGGWQIDTSVQKTGQTSSTKGASGGWDSAVHTAVEGVSDAGGWSKATPDSGEAQTLGEGGWRAESKPHTVSNTETSGWGHTKLPGSDAGGSWNTQGAAADWSKEASGKDKSDGFVGRSGNCASPKSGGDNIDSWGIKGKALLENNADKWGKSAASQETKTTPNNPWPSSFNTSAPSKAWKTPAADENQAACWGTSSLEPASQTSSWDKVKTAPSPIECEKSATELGGWKKATDRNQATGWASSAMHLGTSSVEDGSESNSWSKVKSLPSSSGWENSKATATETSGGWKTTMDGNQAAGWGASATPSATPSVELESRTSSWGKVSPSPSSTGWQISTQADPTSKEGWKQDGEGQIDRWNKEKSSDGDQASGWNKAGNAEGGKDIWANSMDKAKGSEGRGFGQESQGQWKVRDDWGNDPNFGKSKDSDSGQGLGWSQGNSNNENSKSWGGRGNSWNQQRDFDGGRGGFNRGRGRGRYGGRGGRNEDSFEKPGDSDGGWRFGRGGGRGRNGAGGYNGDNSGTREFGRGRGRGQGRGRGHDRGQFESSGWRNGQERFDEGFSNKSLSSWGTTEGSSGWGNSGNSYDGGNKPGWGTAPQDSGRSKNDIDEDHTSSWSKGVSSGKQTDNWSKETRNNDNWNTPKTVDSTDLKKNEMKSTNVTNSFEVSLADWSHGLPESKGTANDDEWAKPKSSPGDHGDTLSGKLNSNEAAESQGGWSSNKVDTQATQPSSETSNSWVKCKEPFSGSTAGSLGSSANWDSKKEPASSHGNWRMKDSSGNQSADWNNGGGSKWGKQSGDQGKSESWSRGSDFGRGGGRGRDNSFSRGRGFGRNSGRSHSHSWNSNDNSGKECNNDGSESFNNSNQEFKTGGSWSRGHGSFEAEKSSWNSVGKSEGENQAKQGSGWEASGSASVNKVESSSVDGSWNPGSSRGSCGNDNSANLDSRSNAWDSSGSQSSDWNKQNGNQDKSESWSRRSDFGRGGGGRGTDNSFSSRGRGPGRNSGGRGYGKQGDDGWQAFNSNQEFKTGGSWNSGGNAEKGSWGGWKSEGENQPAGLAKPGLEAETSKSGWDSPTGFGSNKASDCTGSGEQKNDPWASTNARKKEQDSTTWDNTKSTWNSGLSDEKQKHRLAETDRVGSWDTNNAPSMDGNTKKQGSGWTSGAEGYLPVQAGKSSWIREDGDQSNSGNGGNSGW